MFQKVPMYNSSCVMFLRANARLVPGGGGLGMGWLGINKAIKLKVILSPDIRLRKFSLNLHCKFKKPTKF